MGSFGNMELTVIVLAFLVLAAVIYLLIKLATRGNNKN